jgi:hypothetical protein
LVHLSGLGEPQQVASAATALLSQPPSEWPWVQWLPQSNTLPPPSIAGPGWRRHEFQAR